MSRRGASRFTSKLRRWMRWAPRWLLIQFYPRTWRRRYGTEFAALLQRRLTWKESLDVLSAAVDAHRRAQAPERVPGGNLSTGGAQARYAHCRLMNLGRRQSMARKSGQFACSFCGKRQEQVQRLIAGPNGVYICDACVALCNEIVAEGGAESTHQSPGQQPDETVPAEQHQAMSRWQRMMRRWFQTNSEHHLWHAPMKASEMATHGGSAVF